VQAERIRTWCGENNHELVVMHRGNGGSGTLDDDGRPELAAALSDLEAGRGEVLAVAHIDRLARALHVQEAVLGKAWAVGGRVFSVNDGEVHQNDPSDPMRTFVRQVMGAAAQLERGMVVARMQGARRRKRARGGYIGGDVPYGYRLENGELVPVPEQLQVLATIVADRDEARLPFAAIAARLENDGIPAPAGGTSWYAATVRRMYRRATLDTP
jgi:DNA invertase Pin-like site-specific DNA recombinase